MTLEVGQLYEWTEGASSGIRLVRGRRKRRWQRERAELAQRGE
jgi:hypothetical protein